MRRRAALWAACAALLAVTACTGAPSARADQTSAAPQTRTPDATAVRTDTPVPAVTLTPQPAGAPAVSFSRADLARGTSEGVVGQGPLTLASGTLARTDYVDPFSRSSIAAEAGSWTSEWTSVAFSFDELIASWNADTPAGTWIRIETQGRGSGRDTKFFTLMTWASSDVDIHRTSLNGQKDADGDVNVDTFVRARSAAPLDAYRVRLTLYRRAGFLATPSVRFVAAVASAAFSHRIPSAFGGAEVDLAVPTFSQEIHRGEYPEYDGGGEAWCSPTSTAMVLAFHGTGPGDNDLSTIPYDDPQVDYAARSTYDWSYKGAGNWPANVAYAARFGLEGFVTRLRSLTEAERFIGASIPLVASITGALPGITGGSTSGHLLVIRGFDRNGDVITNDPAVATDDDVRKTYGRAAFERVWLGGSGGTVYVIYPAGKALPANVAGLPPNW
jgi:hypothetical protein